MMRGRAEPRSWRSGCGAETPEEGNLPPAGYCLGLLHRFGKIVSHALGGESFPSVRAVAKGLFRGKTTAAQADLGASRQSEFSAARIMNGEVALDNHRAIVENRYFRSCHRGPMVAQPLAALASAAHTLCAVGILPCAAGILALSIGFVSPTLSAQEIPAAQSAVVAPPGAAGKLPTSSELVAQLRAQGPDALVPSIRYACQVELHRTQHKLSQELDIEEYARLELAYIDGKEQYSWPGETSFREDEMRKMLVMGLSGSGSFGGHLRDVIFGDAAAFGEAVFAVSAESGSSGTSNPGWTTATIPFRVDAGRSGYLVNIDGREIEAAIAGEIVLQYQAMHPPVVSQFSLHAVDLPADFPATAVSESIDLATSTAENGTTAENGVPGLPLNATQRMQEGGQDDYRNEMAYTKCRSFTGEATLHFEGPNASPGLSPTPAGKAQGSPIPATRPVPPGLPLDLLLRSSIDWRKQKTGDPVEAVIARNVRSKGSTVFNEGARVLGRIVELKKVSGRSEGYLIGIVFSEVIDRNRSYSVSLQLEALTGMPKGSRRGISAMVLGERGRFEKMDRTGPDGRPFAEGGFFRAAGPELDVPEGLEMRWVTRTPDQ